MYVIATAGHVDHGKSTLIERLTGIDPDRLAEEKRRGMTIELGFAWCTLPSGRDIGIVDVPGHERFVPTMLSGVGSVGAVLFVVAANEGWMPQSEEHLQILDLLGAQHAVIALTKSDLVENVADVCEGIRARLAGTALVGAEIVPVSAMSGDGLDDVRDALDRTLVDEPVDRGRARLFVDRVFSAKGTGTVVTGTLTGGMLRAGDPVVVMPSGLTARIRGIQSHKDQRESVSPVARVALNLAGIDRDQIPRGSAIVHPQRWLPTFGFDAELRGVRGLAHAIRSNAAFKCYVGASEIDARIAFHDVAEIRNGEHAFARIRLGAPVVVEPHDRFVLRDAARMQTVAGGVVLDAHPPPTRGSERAMQLKRRATADRDEMPTLVVAEAGVVRRDELELKSGSAALPRDATVLPSFAIANAVAADHETRIERAVSEFHARTPLANGVDRGELRRASGIKDPLLFDELLESSSTVVATGALVHLRTHRIALDPASTDAVLVQLQAAGMQPPSLTELEERHGVAFVQALVDAGTLVKVDQNIAFGQAQIDEAKSRIAEGITSEGPLTAARIKTILGTSRKYAIPLCEYLDRTGFTRRNGDLRTLRT